MQKTCKKCGNPMDADEMFCGNCGTRDESANSPYDETGQTLPTKKKKGKAVFVTILSVIAAVVLAALIWQFVFKHLNATVPDVAGMPQAVAVLEITKSELVTGMVTKEYNDTLPEDSVIDQSLKAGTFAKKGTVIDLRVSSGPAVVPVPDVADITQYQAEAAINEANLTVGTITEEKHDTVPAGNVIDQSLPPGTSVARGTAVDLRISSGRDIKPVVVSDGGARPPVSSPPATAVASGPTPEQIEEQLRRIKEKRKVTPEPITRRPAPTQGTYTPPPAPKAVSVSLTTGTPINVITSSTISTEKHNTGDVFEALLNEDIMYDGRVVARRGSTVKGVISESDPGGRVKGVATISLRLTSLILTDGRLVSIMTNNYTVSAPSSVGKDAAKTGIGAGIGAAIGAIAGGGKGAAIGAAIGGAAGTGTALATRGNPAVITPETRITFNLTMPLNVALK